MSDFGTALVHLKAGHRVARGEGWNGKGMWIALSPGGIVPATSFWSPANREYASQQPDKTAVVQPYITMKNAQGQIVPWAPSQSDMLAEDWQVLS